MKRLLLILLAPISTISHGEITSETYCFSSGTSGTAFEMRSYYDTSTRWSSGFVKYKNSNKPISLVRFRSEEEELSKSAPFQVTATWLEIYNEKITGQYEMMSQGANVYSMTYLNYRTKKTTAFLLDTSINFSSEKGCEW